MSKHTKASLGKKSLTELQELILASGTAPQDHWTKDQMIDLLMEQQADAEHVAKGQKEEECVEVVFPAAEGKQGNAPIFFACNGRQFLAKRNMPIKVPKSVLSSITDAVQTVFERDPETDELVSRDVPTYNYTVRELK